MKKYIKPAIVEVKIENEQILANSLNDRMGSGNALSNDLDLDWDEE